MTSPGWMRRWWVAVGIACVLSAPAAAHAKLENEINGPTTKAARGFTNLFTGWMEIPHRIATSGNRRDPMTSVTTGAFKGIMWGALRTGVGVVEILTFWMPAPHHYSPILPPGDFWNWSRYDDMRQTYENTLQ